VNWTKWIRQTHRWVSLAFTLAVIINGIAVAEKKYTGWMGLLALLPLALLLFSGVYLFALPYTSRWRHARLSAAKARS
jgi:hypothetical protein